MTEAEEMVRGLATAIDEGVEEEDIVLYDYVLQKLRDSGLVRLIEAAAKMKEAGGDIRYSEYSDIQFPPEHIAGAWTQAEAAWDAAFADMRERVGRT